MKQSKRQVRKEGNEKRTEDQGTRRPEDRGARGPGRGPEDQGTREDQRTRRPGHQGPEGRRWLGHQGIRGVGDQGTKKKKKKSPQKRKKYLPYTISTDDADPSTVHSFTFWSGKLLVFSWLSPCLGLHPYWRAFSDAAAVVHLRGKGSKSTTLTTSGATPFPPC